MGEASDTGGMEDIGAKIVAMLPALLAILGQSQQPSMPNSLGAYQTRVGSARLPGSGSSLGAMGGQFGEMGAIGGMLGDMFLPAGLRDRLQMGNRGNPTAMAEQRMVERLSLQISGDAQGKQIAEAFGLKEGDKFYDSVVSMSPAAIKMAGLERAASALAPTMLITGGEDLLAASQRLDPQNKLRSWSGGAMMAAFEDRVYTTDGEGNKVVRTTATNGLSADDMASLTSMAADNGLSVELDDDTRERVREDARKRSRKRILERKKTLNLAETITDVDEKEIDAEGQTAVRNAGTVGAAAELLSPVAAELQRGIPQATGDEIKAIMQENGLIGRNKQEAEEITEVVRRLQALGKTVGLTSQEMLNLTRVTNQATGAGFMTSQNTAMQAGVLTKAAADNGMSIAAGERMSKEALQAEQQWQESNIQKAQMAVMANGTEEQKEAMIKAVSEGRGLEWVDAYLADPANRGALDTNFTDDQRAKLNDEMVNQGGVDFLKGRETTKREDQIKSLEKAETQKQAREMTIERAYAIQDRGDFGEFKGESSDEKDKISKIARMKIAETEMEKKRPEIEKEMAEAKVVQEIEKKEREKNGAGVLVQGRRLLESMAKGDFSEGFGTLAESYGYLQSEEVAERLGNFDEGRRTKLAEAATGRASSLLELDRIDKEMKKTGLTADEKKALEERKAEVSRRYTDASTELESFGLREKDASASKVVDQRVAQNAAEPAAGGTTKVDVKLTAEPVVIKLEVTDKNGNQSDAVKVNGTQTIDMRAAVTGDK